MDFWQRARNFAEEAAKRSQELTKEATRKSQELTKGATKISQEIVLETAKRSKELAVEASKRADLIKVEALKCADQIMLFADGITPPIHVPLSLPDSSTRFEQSELLKYGINDELRDFVKGLTLSTFRDFPLQDGEGMPAEPTFSNVRQDLSQWQVRHATLVLSSIKEISRLRYELCPRLLDEKKFWRIYFILVNNHIIPYEQQQNEAASEKAFDNGQSHHEESRLVALVEPKNEGLPSRATSLPFAEQDLDAFLLGDGSSDEGENGAGDFDDDFDKILSASDKG